MKKTILLLPIISLIGCQSNAITPTIPNQTTETFTLQSEKFTPELNLTGNIEANKSIPITAKISGRIDNLNVEIGDRVTKGQIIARYSAENNQNQISYQNAINQIESTKQTTINNTFAAEIQYKNAELALDQNFNEKNSQRQKQFASLQNLSKNSDILLSNAIDFLDQNLAVSRQYKVMNINSSQIASNNSVEKNALKNEISSFLQILNNAPTPNKKISDKKIMTSAKERLILLNRAQTNISTFTKLLRNTPTSSQFIEITKNNLITQTNNISQSLAAQIMNLENMIEATLVMEEQIQLSLLTNESSLKNAQSQLNLAKSSAESQITNAQNNLNLASSFQNEMTIRAPFTGIITEKTIDYGQLVSPGQKMFQIADDSIFKIKTEIPDNTIGQVKINDITNITIDGATNQLTGKITKINPAVNPQTRKIGIEITLEKEPETAIIIGQFAKIEISLSEKEVFMIPKKFIKFDFDSAKVFLQNEGWKNVETGTEKDQNIEISFAKITNNLVIIRQK